MSAKFLSNPPTLALRFSSKTTTNCFIFYPSFTLHLKLPPPTSHGLCHSFHIFPRTHSHFPSTRHFLLASLSSNDSFSHGDQPEESDLLAIATGAVSEFLQDFGITKDDSISIASNSPRYVRMLIDGVLELDETSMWLSWRREGKGWLGGEFGFKDKVILLAKEKGDNGKVAFLESVGLGLSSAINVARYLVGETLSGLIYKVKYMKELFFTGSSDGRLVGKNARCMMKHLSIPVDEDVQQTLSFFEKIEAKRGGLDMLGSDHASFRYLIESFPRLLLLSVESHLKPMVEFLESVGVSRGCMKNIFLLFPPIVFCNVEVLKTRVLAVKEVGIVDKEIGKVLLKYPWTLSRSIQNNYKEILSFFLLEKVSKVHVDRAIRSWPLLLGCSTSKLKLMVDQFGELGVRTQKLGHVIARSPQLLLRKLHKFLQVVSFLEDIGFDKETVGKILVRCPEIFATSVERTLKRKLEFLSSISVSKAHLPRIIKKYPELLVSDPEKTLLPRMKYLRERGLSEREIAFMIRRFSPLLGYSIEEVLKPKLEFLVNTMEKPVKEVVEYPRYFSYSLEKKIKPRFWVIRGRNIKCSLQDMLGKNDEEFAAHFMLRDTDTVPTSHQ